jgi:RNA polymerase sigma-70 factor (ECF subfamily)
MEAADEQLMIAYRDGEAAAFETLYARHKGPLFRFVLRSVKARGEAEELFHDVWLRVIEARERYTPSARFTTWLYTIAHNRVVDHWRRRGLKVASLDTRDSSDDADDPPFEPAAASQDEPQRRAELNEQLRKLGAALEALPPAQREVFLLREEAGLTLPEIAEVAGIDLEAAKSRLRYALAKLREALDDG